MIKDEIKQMLLTTISPFWKKLKDDTNGGFYGELDYDLVLHKDAPKGVILNSRIMWYFSNQYLTLHQEEDLEYAKHAFQFLKEHCLDKEYGGVFWMLSYDGKIVEDMKHTYNQAFAIYALSSYYDATKDQEALDIAMSLFKIIETTCVDEYGYLEAFDRKWVPISNEKLSDNPHLCAKGIIAEKTMNTLLHVLEAYTELYRVHKDPQVGEKLRSILKVFETKVYNPETHILEVFFDHKLNTIADMHSYGHDIEAAWLLDRAADVLGDPQVIEATKKYTVEIAYKVKDVAMSNGSMLLERFEDLIDTTRVWWVQAEAIVGFTNAYQHTNDEAFLELVKGLWKYIKEYMIDKREGSEWYWQVDADGNPSHKPIVEPWKCPYHNGRMCFEVIRRNVNV